MLQKLILDLFLILENNPKQPLHARNSFINQIFWKRIIKKLYKRQLYFSFEPHVIRITLASHSYVARMYSYVIRMSLVCTRMSSVCHSYTHTYVLACHPCVTRVWFYHEPRSSNATLNVHKLSLIFILGFCQYQHKEEIQSLRKLIFYKCCTHWQEIAIQRCIQNPVKHLRRSILKILQTLHRRYLLGFWLCLCNYFISNGDCYVVMSTKNIFLYENQQLAKNAQTLDKNIFLWTFQLRLLILCAWKLILHF